MDDDLMSLRGDDPGDDDLFGGFEDSSDDFDFDFGGLDEADATTLETAAGSSTSPGAGGGDDDVPDWMRELDQPESLRASEPAATIASSSAAPARRERTRKPSASASRSSGGGGGMGLSPQQRMVLSIFLFLDVAVIGVGLLFALNIIAF